MSAKRLLGPGDPGELGARCTPDGVLFSVHSGGAEALDLCLFDEAGNPAGAERFDACTDGVWHGFLPAAKAGQQYGFRAHGRFAPDEGLYFNPQRLLLDPYARALAGCYVGHPANHLCVPVTAQVETASSDDNGFVRSPEFAKDNSAYVPRSVVVSDLDAPEAGVSIASTMRVIYEAHVGGLTKLNDAVAAPLRGTFCGASAPSVIAHLRALGVTSLQLLPVHAFIDEPHLQASDLSNYWGYNTLNFFTPHSAYTSAPVRGSDCARQQFRNMVRALHDANIEVLLDVVYNHTCEGGADGPVLCYRGLDNQAYYRTDAQNKHAYINDTGCGNTLDFNSSVVQRLTLDSLRYFAKDLEVDGFRFDLAVSLGREPQGFNPQHALFQAMGDDPVLSRRTLIAEPWDIGPGGYQTGGFAAPWHEWNDRYRDALRSFWRADAGAQAEMGKRLHGSSDLFENNGRGVNTSINFLSAHDGFTLADMVSYGDKHNAANGEENRDGHAHNLSDNMGEEGETTNPDLLAARDRRSRAMLATLIFSQGTPMVLAGDELRNSQKGNNNAYCQDNPTGWLQWDALTSAHVNLLRRCIDIRASLSSFRETRFVHTPWEATAAMDNSAMDIGPAVGWLRSDGLPMQDQDWMQEAAPTALPFAQILSTENELVLITLNPSPEDCHFALPLPGAWLWRLNSALPSGKPRIHSVDAGVMVTAASLNVFSQPNAQRNDSESNPYQCSALDASAPSETEK